MHIRSVIEQLGYSPHEVDVYLAPFAWVAVPQPKSPNRRNSPDHRQRGNKLLAEKRPDERVFESAQKSMIAENPEKLALDSKSVR